MSHEVMRNYPVFRRYVTNAQRSAAVAMLQYFGRTIIKLCLREDVEMYGLANSSSPKPH